MDLQFVAFADVAAVAFTFELQRLFHILRSDHFLCLLWLYDAFCPETFGNTRKHPETPRKHPKDDAETP